MAMDEKDEASDCSALVMPKTNSSMGKLLPRVVPVFAAGGIISTAEAVGAVVVTVGAAMLA